MTTNLSIINQKLKLANIDFGTVIYEERKSYKLATFQEELKRVRVEKKKEWDQRAKTSNLKHKSATMMISRTTKSRIKML